MLSLRAAWADDSGTSSFVALEGLTKGSNLLLPFSPSGIPDDALCDVVAFVPFIDSKAFSSRAAACSERLKFYPPTESTLDCIVFCL
jgi:hypothetical protein